MAEELARHGYRISPGSLYPTLHKMEAEGLVTSRAQVVGGRVRRSYVATAKGRRTLKQAKAQLLELAAEILGDTTP
jgi:DNA-binding PadR family transcriptional regulator